MKLPARITAFVVLSFVLYLAYQSNFALAQKGIDEQTNGVQLVDISLLNDYVISLPKDWLVWKSENYKSPEDSIADLEKMIRQVSPNVPDNTAKQLAQKWSTLQLVAFRPALFNGNAIYIKVNLLTSDDAAKNLKLQPSAVTPAQVLNAIGAVAGPAASINKRTAAIGLGGEKNAAPVPVVVYIFPQQKMVGDVEAYLPTDYFTSAMNLWTLIGTSLRLKGEPLDTEAWKKFLAAKGSIPNWITLPEPTAATAQSTLEATPALLSTQDANSVPNQSATASAAAIPTVLKGHSGYVLNVAWAPNGKTVATASADKTVRLWEPISGKSLRTLSGDLGAVYGVAWSPDGKTLATASEDPLAHLWNAANGKPLRTLKGHIAGLASIAWSPDGKTLATGSFDKRVNLWNAASGKLMRTLDGHTDYVLSVAWSPDGKTLATGSRDLTVRLWDTASGKLLRTLGGHTSTVYSVAWSPDGKMLVSGSHDTTIRIWDASNGNLLRTLNGHTKEVLGVAWSKDGKLIASGSGDRTARLWDAETGQSLRILRGHRDFIRSVALSPDSKTLATASGDQTVWLWDLSGSQ